jgi:hypothetical protein
MIGQSETMRSGRGGAGDAPGFSRPPFLVAGQRKVQFQISVFCPPKNTLKKLKFSLENFSWWPMLNQNLFFGSEN